jgi:uncharacterized membrane protein
MSRTITRYWWRGIVSTFLAGLFIVLPIVITIGIVSWVAATLEAWIGPASALGKALRFIGLRVVSDETAAVVVGWVIVLVGLWLLGMQAKSAATYRLENFIQTTFNRIPLLNSIYRPVSQVVSMLKKNEQADMKAMAVVFCDVSKDLGGGFLGLRASPDVYRFGDRECCLIYLPTSPIPMSGWIVFVPVESVRPIDMDVEHMMQIYFSLGVLASKVVPGQYTLSSTAA